MTEERDPEREAWKNAKTLDDLGELMARWIEGALEHRPAYYGSEPDEETAPLRDTLAAYNRKGLLTTNSQPGMPIDDEGCGQRAWVEGYAKEARARRLGALGLWTDLLVFLFPPGNYTWGYQIPITVEEYHPFTWTGHHGGHEELEPFAEDLSHEALDALARAWKVVLIDPRWGRKSYLWEHVSAVLEGKQDADKRFSVTPAHPDLGTDFVF
jgi:hypothetical protein